MSPGDSQIYQLVENGSQGTPLSGFTLEAFFFTTGNAFYSGRIDKETGNRILDTVPFLGIEWSKGTFPVSLIALQIEGDSFRIVLCTEGRQQKLPLVER